jgi:hypothetical protein
LPAPPTTEFISRAIPGAYIHATAVNNLIRHDALIDLGPIHVGLILLFFGALTALVAIFLVPIWAVLVYLGFAAAYAAFAVAAFNHTLVLPFVEVLLVWLAALAVTIVYRFAWVRSGSQP